MDGNEFFLSEGSMAERTMVCATIRSPGVHGWRTRVELDLEERHSVDKMRCKICGLESRSRSNSSRGWTWLVTSSRCWTRRRQREAVSDGSFLYNMYTEPDPDHSGAAAPESTDLCEHRSWLEKRQK
ncbi:hypothetical protein PoB_002978000 [Plakobranchus ocellatus]|uniref:Uncharacterized protein n=1 Tax=Plakobranchus ocellatus TaxID=259542 RepID=A0AAV4A7B3_9GAST|nr:hypothetical protein PoB_002978000 [Plakobranchus ocellatus]